MYDQEYGLEHGGVAKQLNQVQAAYERGLRDAADVLDAEVRYHMKNNGAHGFCEDYGCTNLTEFAKQILALKDRGAK
jgi:hypothetical protein